ncbi:MAG: fibronectin type III domain-containing protein [Bacteroidaceae bacterium]
MMKRNYEQNMKRINPIRSLLWVAMAAIPALAVSVPSGPMVKMDNPDSVAVISDTIPMKADTIDPQLRPTSVPIKMVARSYGDSVVLRWAIDRFPEWLYLTETGVDVYRLESESGSPGIDTIAFGLKPLSLQQMRKRYADTDTLALLAMGTIYGKGGLTPEMTPWTPGSMGVFVDIEEDQKMRIASAFLVAEWRPDLAEALGLRIVDRTAKKGHTYDYFIRPSVPDTTKFFYIEGGRILSLRNEKYKPEPYDVVLSDSVTGHGKMTLRWNDTRNGSFEIFRRQKGQKEWMRVNDRPYLPPFKWDLENEDALFVDRVDTLGTYEYAVQAHDAFGDLTEMSKPLTVTFPDMLPPSPPTITKIVIDRPVEDDPSAQVFANVYFHKDTVERDFVRYVPMYYHERDSLKQWRLLSNQYIAPEDTLVRIDVTHVSTGLMTIAAVDTAENMGYAMPTLLRVTDLKPPAKPANLRAIPKITGEILLTWEMSDSLDVQHYEVFYANDSTHQFVPVRHDFLSQCAYQDTVATNANQRYIYYTVRARDYARNIGPFSDTIQVLRPNPYPPTAAHLDSAQVLSESVYMRWAVGGEEHIGRHILKRKMEKQPEDSWVTLAIFDGDSVAADKYMLEYTDRPPVNRYDRYEYAVETVSLWDVSSGPSASYLARVRGKNVVDVEIKAFAAYDEKSGESRISWEVGEIPVSAPYFFCIYRKGKENEWFVYMTDVDSTERLYTDVRTRPGETAEYYVSIRFRDGRATRKSNVVTVVVPRKVKNEE